MRSRNSVTSEQVDLPTIRITDGESDEKMFDISVETAHRDGSPVCVLLVDGQERDYREDLHRALDNILF